MCQITKFVFILLIGASWASYFNPVVKTILPTEYGVPREYTPVKPFEEYGVPQIRTPSAFYGVPTSFRKVVPKVLVPPATRYGVPVQRVAVPQSKIIEFSPTFEFKSQSEEIVVPSERYGVPTFEVPAIEYGAPVTKTASFVTYEAPRATIRSFVPHEVYEEPSQEYGLPQIRVPATVYGLE